MNIGGTLYILCDADYRSHMRNIGVRIPDVTIEQAEDWWKHEQEKQQQKQKANSFLY